MVAPSLSQREAVKAAAPAAATADLSAGRAGGAAAGLESLDFHAAGLRADARRELAEGSPVLAAFERTSADTVHPAAASRSEAPAADSAPAPEASTLGDPPTAGSRALAALRSALSAAADGIERAAGKVGEWMKDGAAAVGVSPETVERAFAAVRSAWSGIRAAVAGLFDRRESPEELSSRAAEFYDPAELFQLVHQHETAQERPEEPAELLYHLRRNSRSLLEDAGLPNLSGITAAVEAYAEQIAREEARLQAEERRRDQEEERRDQATIDALLAAHPELAGTEVLERFRAQNIGLNPGEAFEASAAELLAAAEREYLEKRRS